MSASGPDLEIEVKIRYPAGAAAARELIESHGYRLSQPRALESDQLFDLEDGRLRASGQLLRLRRKGNGSTVTFKGPARGGRYKNREEIEFDVSDPAAFCRVLQRLGYQPGFRYEKYRMTFAGRDAGEEGIVTIDETPIGVFLELEGTPDWIDRTAAGLGFSTADYVTASYSGLYTEYHASHPNAPDNMTFPAAPSY